MQVEEGRLAEVINIGMLCRRIFVALVVQQKIQFLMLGRGRWPGTGLFLRLKFLLVTERKWETWRFGTSGSPLSPLLSRVRAAPDWHDGVDSALPKVPGKIGSSSQSRPSEKRPDHAVERMEELGIPKIQQRDAKD